MCTYPSEVETRVVAALPITVSVVVNVVVIVAVGVLLYPEDVTGVARPSTVVVVVEVVVEVVVIVAVGAPVAGHR